MKSETRDYITRRPKEKMPTTVKLQLIAYLSLMFFSAVIYGTDLGNVLIGIWLTVTYQMIVNATKKK